MKSQKSVLLSPLLLAVATTIMILISCACPTPITPPQPSGGSAVAITFTADHTSLKPGECATLQWSVQGGLEVELNGQSVGQTGQKRVCPSETTPYVLDVGAGETTIQREIVITVEGTEPPPTKTPTPLPTEPPPATKTPTPTQPPPSPGVTIDFRADNAALTAGDCTTLRWDVEHATAVYLNGAGVAGHGSKQVCPATTTTYVLRVEHAGGVTEKTVTINVTAPQLSFTFSPKSGLAGSEVQLYLSAAVPVSVYFNGKALPKKVSADGKTLTVTIPGGASTDYFELRWNGQSVKSSEPFVVITPLSFTFNPKSGPAGSEVNLYLSAAVPVSAYFGGKPLPKKVLADGKTLVVTIPGGASSDYFELRWDGQSVKASEPFTVTPPPQGDLILQDIFLSTQGEVVIRVATDPSNSLSGSFEYQIVAPETNVVVAQGSFPVPPGSKLFWTGYKPGNSVTLVVSIDPEGRIPETDEGNNTMTKNLTP